MNKIITMGFVCLSLLSATLPVRGQETEISTPLRSETTPDGGVAKASKAWEIGLGGSLINWTRVSLTGFSSTPDNYLYNLKANHLMGGVNLYVARELNPWFYLDLQGTVGMSKNNNPSSAEDRKYDMLYMGGLGLQFRFTPLLKSKWVEPYLRVGVNYLYKDFSSLYAGNFQDDPTGEAHWVSSDVWNPEGRPSDKNSFFPVSFGAGLKAWLSDCFGLSLQGEYLMPVQSGLPHFAQVSAGVVWRIGGKSKHPAPVVEYVEVEKPVERIVERVVEKKIEAPALVETLACNLLENIHFEFDKDVLTVASEETLDRLAELLKAHTDSKFLVTGYTDAKGSDAYNLDLSARRAKKVHDALIERGVPADMLKWRGVGKRASVISSKAEDGIREGDRKVLLERVTNPDYWNAIDNK